jgi:L-alanine-DL-glutamate epimerase-like enolase superfamily enzyme
MAMRISDIKAINLRGGNNTIVQVFSDEGIVGIGHIDSSPVARYIVEGELKPLLLGEDPLEIERLWNKMYRAIRWHGLRGVSIHAMAGIDMALWDLAGKKLGVPVWKLLGGRYRDKVIPYASASFGRKSREELAREASMYRDQGFRAVKFGWGLFGRVSIEKDVEMVRGVREGAGDDVKVIIDAGAPWEANAARMIRTIREIERYGILFFEEPLPQDDLEGYRRIKAMVEMPISSGESLGSIYEFKPLIDNRLVDIVQPDPSRVGITQWKRIARMAEEANMLCIPHDWSTGINILAQIHLVASIPNGEYVEYHRPITHPEDPEALAFASAIMDELLMEPFELKNGYFEVPDKPGLGIELNETVLRRYAIK